MMDPELQTNANPQPSDSKQPDTAGQADRKLSPDGGMILQGPEVQALDAAARLIKYAAESPKTLPDDVVLPIAAAWKAQQSSGWSPQISSNFWTAYSRLCDLIKPVTLDTINAGASTIEARKWIFFGERCKISLTQRTARRYLCLMLILLLVSILFGFVVSSTTKLSDDIGALITNGDTVAADVLNDLTSVKSDLDAVASANENSLQISLDDPRIKPDARTNINKLRSRLQDLYYVADRMHQKVDWISRIVLLSRMHYEEGDLSRLPVLDNGFDNVRNYYQTRRSVTAFQQSVFLLSSFYAALVPLLLGALGACTYVLRLMSDEIANFTFSSVSPTKHFVRIALGSLGGVAIGLGGIVTGSGLSAAALAFLAGYAVEPVFATLDSIAGKFRSDP